MSRGKLIVIYGINNLGKSTQAKILVDRLKKTGRKAEYFKYAAYEQVPSGIILNNYLREGNSYNLSPREFQLIHVYNRAQHWEILQEKLNAGIDMILEDYWGTGVAWGVGAGVDKDFLLYINQQFQIEDLALLFRGERFMSGKENNHKHEDDGEMMEKVAKIHEDLAKQFNWIPIDANQDVDNVSIQVWNEVKKILN